MAAASIRLQIDMRAACAEFDRLHQRVAQSEQVRDACADLLERGVDVFELVPTRGVHCAMVRLSDPFWTILEREAA